MVRTLFQQRRVHPCSVISFFSRNKFKYIVSVMLLESVFEFIILYPFILVPALVTTECGTWCAAYWQRSLIYITRWNIWYTRIFLLVYKNWPVSFPGVERFKLHEPNKSKRLGLVDQHCQNSATRHLPTYNFLLQGLLSNVDSYSRGIIKSLFIITFTESWNLS